jgi:hypothetical protein
MSSPGISRATRTLKALRPNRWIKALSGAAVVWAFLPDGDSTALGVHRAFRREIWIESSAVERLVLCVGFVLWMPVTLFLVAKETRLCGPRVRRDHGVGLARQVAQQLSLSVRCAVAPPWYYMFELHDDAKRARALEYLYRFETKAGLYDILRRHLSSPETGEALSDKAAFALRCQACDLPAVSALAVAEQGAVTRLDGGGEGLPRVDVFLKPKHGAGGRGAERWLYDGKGTWAGHDGSVLDEAGLSARLRALSREAAYVVRRFVRNHPEVAELSPGALSTVRIVTCRGEDGRPEVTHAVLRMARDASVVVDNFHAGGLAAAVDLASGELGQASDMGLRDDSRWHDVHPGTGARITGRRLPLWNDVMELALRAHQAFDDQFAVGWDVAILEDGPSLVEGNKSPDLDILQRIGRGPLGNSRFGELLLFHVEKVRRLRLQPPREVPVRPVPVAGAR